MNSVEGLTVILLEVFLIFTDRRSGRKFALKAFVSAIRRMMYWLWRDRSPGAFFRIAPEYSTQHLELYLKFRRDPYWHTPENHY
jgi:hypothetical protein